MSGDTVLELVEPQSRPLARDSDLHEEAPEVEPTFNTVLIVNAKTGELTDMGVNSPTRLPNPEALAKALAIASCVVQGVAKELGSGEVKELDIVTDNALVVVLHDGRYLRVGISST